MSSCNELVSLIETFFARKDPESASRVLSADYSSCPDVAPDYERVLDAFDEVSSIVSDSVLKMRAFLAGDYSLAGFLRPLGYARDPVSFVLARFTPSGFGLDLELAAALVVLAPDFDELELLFPRAVERFSHIVSSNDVFLKYFSGAPGAPITRGMVKEVLSGLRDGIANLSLFDMRSVENFVASWDLAVAVLSKFGSPGVPLGFLVQVLDVGDPLRVLYSTVFEGLNHCSWFASSIGEILRVADDVKRLVEDGKVVEARGIVEEYSHIECGGFPTGTPAYSFREDFERFISSF